MPGPRRFVVLMLVSVVTALLSACDNGTVTITPTRSVALPPVPSPSSSQPGATATSGSTVSAPKLARTSARLQVASGVTALAVHAEDLGPDLFRATATAGTLAAAITGDTVTLTRSGDGGPAVVDVALDRQPAWSVAIAGGATAATLDLATGRVGTIDLASGVSTFEMGLPAARGTTRVVMSGGSSQMRVHLTGPSPVRVTLAGGAGSVEVDGASRSGVPGGTVLVPPTWSAAHDRYDILCSAGVSALVVDRAA